MGPAILARCDPLHKERPPRRGFSLDLEAWNSGASSWSAATREAYANDLGDSRSLVGVTTAENRSKSDQDVAEWLPDLERCRYLREFVAVKLRWRLSVDSGEKAAMTSLASGCTNTTITVTRAR